MNLALSRCNSCLISCIRYAIEPAQAPPPKERPKKTPSPDENKFKSKYKQYRANNILYCIESMENQTRTGEEIPKDMVLAIEKEETHNDVRYGKLPGNKGWIALGWKATNYVTPLS
jgi:hypothetical protein